MAAHCDGFAPTWSVRPRKWCWAGGVCLAMWSLYYGFPQGSILSPTLLNRKPLREGAGVLEYVVFNTEMAHYFSSPSSSVAVGVLDWTGPWLW